MFVSYYIRHVTPTIYPNQPPCKLFMYKPNVKCYCVNHVEMSMFNVNHQVCISMSKCLCSM
ncbi:hypothetical protein HanRHA438_Chr08g0350661 [Helianthus annuus]|nr:hypothetical protein HanRHA438_Chr08g0350661 [Helianthus annuus]